MQAFIEQYVPNRNVIVPPEEIRKLCSYDFPGNVRELRNIIERSLILQEGNYIYPSKLVNSEMMSEKAQTDGIKDSGATFIEQGVKQKWILPEIEKQYILAAFENQNKNIAHTAAFLGISLSTLKRKLRDFGVR
ncbi:MAG: hypothetical protein K1X72_02855 [Pyrinomonadaceae bacterium]|nr:hypothetical protein [Pyrinomonadaceae bacterium]